MKPRSAQKGQPTDSTSLSKNQTDLEEQLDNTRRILDAFRDIATAPASPEDLDRLLGLVLSRASNLLQADHATLYLIDDATGELVSPSVEGGSKRTIRLAVGQGIAGAVVSSGKAIRVSNVQNDQRSSWRKEKGKIKRSILAVPMKNHVNQTIGVLQVLNYEERDFTDEEESLLAALACQAAIAIDNVKLYLAVVKKNQTLAEVQQELERKIAYLKLLFELESTMVRAPDEEQLIKALLESTVRATHTKAGAALLLDSNGRNHILFAYQKGESTELTRFEVSRPLGTLARTIRDAKPVILKDARRSKKTVEELSLMGLTAQRILTAPILSEEREILGALALYDRDDESTFNEDDQELLSLVAANASTAISLLRSRLSQRVSDRLSTIGRLLSSLLHDLKTPMAVISGYVQLLATTEDKERRKEYSKLVLKQFAHITTMQREILAFARGEGTLLVSKVYLQNYFEELRAQLERELEERGVSLQVEMRDRGVARFDEAKMTRALHNLARNAADAMGPSGGTLYVIVDRQQADLIIRIRDTGPGIPDAIRGRIFDYFVTADKAEGTGLGLAIVKKIVEEHGGKIDVTSSSEGAEFIIRLPHAAL